MRTGGRAAIITALIAFWSTTALGQQPAQEIPRTADGTPRLDGIWQALTEANWDIRPHSAGHRVLPELGTLTAVHPGLGFVEGNELPYQDWAIAQSGRTISNSMSRLPITMSCGIGATISPERAEPRSSSIRPTGGSRH